MLIMFLSACSFLGGRLLRLGVSLYGQSRVRFAAALRVLHQNRLSSLRERLCAAGFPACRSCRPLALADHNTAFGRHCHRAGDPGPVFTTATFIGYLLAGLPGALIATAGIFLPSFILVAIGSQVVPLLRRSAIAGAFLDGVIVASLALMAVVTWSLGRSAVIDLPTSLLAAGSAVLLIRFRLNSLWLVLGGALIGLLVCAATR